MKHFYICLLVVLTVLANAQDSQAWLTRGTWEVGVSGYYNQHDNKTQTSTTNSSLYKYYDSTAANFSLNAGYFVLKNLEIGAITSYDNSASNGYSTSGTATSKSKSNSISIAPTIRLLFNVNEGAVIVPYVGIEGGMFFGNSSSGLTTTSSSKTDGYLYAGSVGLKYFPVDVASLNIDAKYRVRSYENKNSSTSSTTTSTRKYETESILLTIGASIYF